MSINEILENMTIEELCGQVLCPDISDKDDPKEIEEMFKRDKPSGFFVAGMTAEKILFYKEMANKYSKVPVIVAADVEYGPGSAIKDMKTLPHPMAWGAANDSDLIEQAGKITGQICKASGIDYTFSPFVDLSVNPLSSVTNVRVISDDVNLTEKIASAYFRGLSAGGLVCACKSFPGDSLDSRNPHFCTVENTMSKEEWDNTSGKIYSSLFNQGCQSVMVGHAALLCYDDYRDEIGCLPAVLSEKIMKGLLRDKLGFTGCIVSDAMSMIGACSRCKVDELAEKFIVAGGDLVLFPEKNDRDNLVNAVKNGKLSLTRLKDAVYNVLKLKEKAGLFVKREITVPDKGLLEDTAMKIAEKSIKVVRDYDDVIKNGIRPDSRVLCVYLFRESRRKTDMEHVFDVLENELKNRNCNVTVRVNPSHREFETICEDYDAVLLCAKFLPSDFGCGSSLAMGWENMLTFWRGYVLAHKKLIFVSFGDPYKLYEVPFIRTYVNAFSPSEFSQKAFVKMIFGEIVSNAINPVSLDGYFATGK